MGWTQRSNVHRTVSFNCRGISIFNDAYFTSNKGRKSLLGVLAFIAGAEYLGIAFGQKNFVTNGIANLDIIPIIVMIWAISIFVMVVIKTIIDKKAVEEWRI